MTLLVGSIFHMTRKIVSEMTYNVSMGTLNPTIPYYTILCALCQLILPPSVLDKHPVHKTAAWLISKGYISLYEHEMFSTERKLHKKTCRLK